ncbi:MAG: hypothetical protein R3C53_03530 [Pirellulaceae bacterium]
MSVSPAQENEIIHAGPVARWPIAHMSLGRYDRSRDRRASARDELSCRWSLT